MAALHDSGSKDPMAKQAGRGGGGEPKQKRARSLDVDAGGEGGSSAPATALASASASRAHPKVASSSLVDVTLEDANALKCSMCFLPLKPPIFWSDEGHAVCSRCHDKLQAIGRYRRCHTMERLVESIRVPCAYAAHGCALRPVYYDQESHRSVCEHAPPCHCPGEACSFVGSKDALLDHCSTAHRWPCITTAKANELGFYAVCLRDDFNLLVADLYKGNNNKGSTANIKQCLLLLTVVPQPYARIISVYCIDPHTAVRSFIRRGDYVSPDSPTSGGD